MRKILKNTLVTLSLVLVLLLGGGSYGAWTDAALAITETPVAPADHSRFEALGTDPEQGIPFWIWLMLPRLFPEYLPDTGGYTSLGMVWEPGAQMPVGFTQQPTRFHPVAMTCAACHLDPPRQVPQTVPATVSTNGFTAFDWQGYQNFLGAAAQDPRFSPQYLISAISHDHDFSVLEKLKYRFRLIPQVKTQLLELING